MKTWVRKSLKVGVLSAGILLVAGGTAQAADLKTSDNDGVLNGNQILADIDIPIDVCGNAIGVLGNAGAACVADAGGGESATAHGLEGLETGGNHGLGAGNQVLVPVSIPINICGNAIGVLGHTAAGCGTDDGDSSGYGSGGGRDAEGAGSWQTGGSHGLLNSNQILADVDVPIDVCGNAIGVLGNAAAACGVQGGGGGEAEDGPGSWQTGGNHGLLNGNQILADIDVPINVCGNAIGVLGNAAAACGGDGDGPGEEPETPGEEPEEPGEEPEEPGEEPEEPETPGEEPETPTTPGAGYDEEGARSGGAEQLPVFNSIAGLTKLTQSLPLNQSAGRHAEVSRAGASGWSTGNNGGLLNGNQILADVDIPIDVRGNAVGVLGTAIAASR